MLSTAISEVFDLLSGQMRGYEKIWILGDDFAYNTYQQYFKNLKAEDGTPNTYTYLNFEVRAYLTSQNSMNSKNILSRLRNALVTALNEHSVLPKLIVLVPDDDIINQVADDSNEKTSLDFHYERLLSGLCNLLAKSLTCYKDMLPLKAKRESVPHLLWVSPPAHKFFSEDNNRRRKIFGKSLQIAVSAQKNMTMLKLVKFWDSENSNLFLQEQYRYTSEGLTMYWRSVDATIRFWNIALSKKVDKIKPKQSAGVKEGNLKINRPDKRRRFNNRYNWYSSNYSARRRLPTPP